MNGPQASPAYRNAPISEVVCGVTFTYGLLGTEQIIYDLLALFKKTYPIVEFRPPIVHEELTGYEYVNELNPAHSGPGAYRLRSADLRWMVQIQQDKVFLNWIRKDDESVGAYPGFGEIFGRFQQILEETDRQLGQKKEGLQLQKHLRRYQLLYQDRFPWKAHIPELAAINQLINIQVPTIPGLNAGEPNSPNNIFSKYTIPLRDIGGFATMSLNTTTQQKLEPFIIFECNMVGILPDQEMKSWFDITHQLQINVFESIFQKKLLNKWI